MPEGEVRGFLVKLWLLQSFHHAGLSTVLLHLPATGGDWVIMTLICEQAFSELTSLTCCFNVIQAALIIPTLATKMTPGPLQPTSPSQRLSQEPVH